MNHTQVDQLKFAIDGGREIIVDAFVMEKTDDGFMRETFGREDSERAQCMPRKISQKAAIIDAGKFFTDH